jgi:hypothetical protein
MEEPAARTEPSVTIELEELPLERLCEVVRRGGTLEDWNKEFGILVHRVAAVVRAKFRSDHLAQSAALSAMATVLRRARDGELDVEGPDKLFGHVLLVAHHKAWNKVKQNWNHRPLPAWLEPVDTHSLGEDGEPDQEQLIRAALKAEVIRQLELILERMKLLLKSKQQREVFELLYRNMYEARKLTVGEIASRCRVSERTVVRVRRTVTEHWPQLLEEARCALEALKTQLRQ